MSEGTATSNQPLDEALASSDQLDGRSDEDPKERLNRKLIEVLNELRVGLPGVQVLFAFLLTVPFSSGFADVTDFQRAVYAASLVAAALSSILMIAPAAYHRHRFRTMDHETGQAKLEMLVAQGRLAIAGLAVLAVTMSLVVFLVFDVILSLRWAGGVAAALVLAFLWFWYGLPISRRSRDPDAN
ncbi:MAG: DUF6328 family protein [Actinomycetota bacterium]